MSDLSYGGISLEQYARLCAAMADTAGDESKEFVIASAEGVSSHDWQQAKAGFTARMQDPADMGKTATAFMPLYQAAQAAARGGGEPCPILTYTQIVAAYSFERDAQDNQVPPELIYQRHGITAAKFNEITGYWTPRVNDPNDSAATEFRTLLQAESDQIFGLYRDARSSLVDPEDEDTSPADRQRALEAIANARRPIEANPSARSPGAGPVVRRAAAPAPVAAPPPAPRPAPAPAPAPTAAPRPVSMASPPPQTLVAPAAAPGGQSDEERMFGAAIHGGVLVGLAGFAPLIIWLMNKDGKNDYLAFRARQAMIAQFGAMIVFIAFAILTCGFGAVLILPWMAFEAWMAWRAWNGERPGYPAMEDWNG